MPAPEYVHIYTYASTHLPSSDCLKTCAGELSSATGLLAEQCIKPAALAAERAKANDAAKRHVLFKTENQIADDKTSQKWVRQGGGGTWRAVSLLAGLYSSRPSTSSRASGDSAPHLHHKPASDRLTSSLTPAITCLTRYKVAVLVVPVCVGKIPRCTGSNQGWDL